MRPLYHPERDQIDLTAVLDALSDPTRLGIVAMLAECEELRCGAFGALEASKTNLTYHFAKLREAGVTRARIDGNFRYISLRRDDLEARFPGLLPSIIEAARRTTKIPAEVLREAEESKARSG